MIGIASYGAYIPLHRLARAEIGRAWGAAPVPGEKAVAYFDEDSITMAVAAALDCVKGFELNSIDGVYFASTTSPFWEKLAATTIAAAMGLRRDILTTDFGGSLRAGTNALKSALDTVSAGSADTILVTVADTRMGLPNGDREMAFGDGAAAFLVSKAAPAINVEGVYSVSNELYDFWRADREAFVRAWEERFDREVGYTAVVPDAVKAALAKFKLKPSDFSKVCFYAPEPRQFPAAAAAAGFDVKGGQVEDILYDLVGNTGSAQALMVLVAALEKAKAEDRVLLVSYGDGCDVLALKVGAGIDKLRDRRGIKRHLQSKRMILTYGKYVLWRQLMQTQPPARPPLPPVSASALWRDRERGLSLHGAKCKNCGTPQYPLQRVCVVCQAVDQYESYSFADKKGKLSTFSHDNLAASLDRPSTVCVVDFEGGGRMMCDMTDRDPSDVVIGMPVEMTFRKLHYIDGIHNYWWKCSPIRC